MWLRPATESLTFCISRPVVASPPNSTFQSMTTFFFPFFFCFCFFLLPNNKSDSIFKTWFKKSFSLWQRTRRNTIWNRVWHSEIQCVHRLPASRRGVVARGQCLLVWLIDPCSRFSNCLQYVCVGEKLSILWFSLVSLETTLKARQWQQTNAVWRQITVAQNHCLKRGKTFVATH